MDQEIESFDELRGFQAMALGVLGQALHDGLPIWAQSHESLTLSRLEAARRLGLEYDPTVETSVPSPSLVERSFPSR